MIFFGVCRLRDFFVQRLRDFVCGEVAWFLCVERLRDFSHLLTQSGCMIYFSGGCMIFFQRGCAIFFGEVAWFFVESLRDFFVCEEVAWFFFVWRSCVIFCEKRLEDILDKQIVHINKYWLSPRRRVCGVTTRTEPIFVSMNNLLMQNLLYMIFYVKGFFSNFFFS